MAELENKFPLVTFPSLLQDSFFFFSEFTVSSGIWVQKNQLLKGRTKSMRLKRSWCEKKTEALVDHDSL